MAAEMEGVIELATGAGSSVKTAETFQFPDQAGVEACRRSVPFKAGLPRWIEFFDSFYALLVCGANKGEESMDPSFATSAVD